MHAVNRNYQKCAPVTMHAVNRNYQKCAVLFAEHTPQIFSGEMTTHPAVDLTSRDGDVPHAPLIVGATWYVEGRVHLGFFLKLWIIHSKHFFCHLFSSCWESSPDKCILECSKTWGSSNRACTIVNPGRHAHVSCCSFCSFLYRTGRTSQPRYSS